MTLEERLKGMILAPTDFNAMKEVRESAVRMIDAALDKQMITAEEAKRLRFIATWATNEINKTWFDRSMRRPGNPSYGYVDMNDREQFFAQAITEYARQAEAWRVRQAEEAEHFDRHEADRLSRLRVRRQEKFIAYGIVGAIFLIPCVICLSMFFLL